MDTLYSGFSTPSPELDEARDAAGTKSPMGVVGTLESFHQTRGMELG